MPYSYSAQAGSSGLSDFRYGVFDGRGSVIATCYIEENARLIVDTMNAAAEADAELARLRTEAAGLRAALKPFADYAKAYDGQPDCTGDLPVGTDPLGLPLRRIDDLSDVLTLDDCRRARAALAGPGDAGGGEG